MRRPSPVLDSQEPATAVASRRSSSQLVAGSMYSGKLNWTRLNWTQRFSSVQFSAVHWALSRAAALNCLAACIQWTWTQLTPVIRLRHNYASKVLLIDWLHSHNVGLQCRALTLHVPCAAVSVRQPTTSSRQLNDCGVRIAHA